MTRPPFSVVLGNASVHADALARLRATVEAGLPPTADDAAADALGMHAFALAADGELIGHARLSAARRIDAVRVVPDWRRRGVGSALLHSLVEQARTLGWSGLEAAGNPAARSLLGNLGFLPAATGADAAPRHQLRLDGPMAVDGLTAAVAASCAVITQARRGLWLYSRALDPGLLDAPEVVAALRRFATARHATSVQVLLQDGTAARSSDAPLLRLAQRLGSTFSFRRVSDPVDTGYPSAYLLSDRGAYYFRPTGHRYDDGETWLQGAARTRQLQREFAQVWERSPLWQEIRPLGI